MKLEEFISALTELLVERSVPPHIASYHVNRLYSQMGERKEKLIAAYPTKESLIPIAEILAPKILGSASKESTQESARKAAPPETPDESKSEDDTRPPVWARSAFIPASPVRRENDAKEDVDDDAVGGGEYSSADDENDGDGTEEYGEAGYGEESNVDAPTLQVPLVTYDDGDYDAEDELATSRVLPTDILRAHGLYARDEIDEYAPDDETLSQMGFTSGSYEAESIDRSEDKTRDILALPPLPELRETVQGKRNFIITAICLSPLIAICAILYFGAWGAVFAALAAVIAALIAALVAVSAGGAFVSIAGIIYGIVKLSSQHAEGVFEIGLGIAVAGATLLAAVLIYNLALRFMPWVIKKTGRLCRFLTRKMHILILNIRGRFSRK